jgi:hypothetical protein
MTAQNPFCGQHAAFEWPITLQSLDGILRAGGKIAAIGSEKRGNRLLIKPDKKNHEFF